MLQVLRDEPDRIQWRTFALEGPQKVNESFQQVPEGLLQNFR